MSARRGETILEVRCGRCGEYFNPPAPPARFNVVNGQRYEFDCPSCQYRSEYMILLASTPEVDKRCGTCTNARFPEECMPGTCALTGKPVSHSWKPDGCFAGCGNQWAKRQA